MLMREGITTSLLCRLSRSDTCKGIRVSAVRVRVDVILSGLCKIYASTFARGCLGLIPKGDIVLFEILLESSRST